MNFVLKSASLIFGIALEIVAITSGYTLLQWQFWVSAIVGGFCFCLFICLMEERA